MALTDKQEMFCREYLIDLNATQAAIRAGYSEKTAPTIACENLIKPNVQQRQKSVAALDAKYTKELANVKAENDALQRKLDRGGQMLVSGSCPKQATGTASLDNGTTVELSPVAGRNVLGIRAGIKSDQSKIKALQQYISEQCLK